MTSIEHDFYTDFINSKEIQFFLDWKRVLPSKKWNICISKELSNHIKLSRDAELHVESLKEKAMKGEELLCYHSTDVINQSKPDYLLRDWNIFHLHSGHGKKQSSTDFADRSGDLLFLTYYEDNLYLIDIKPHGKWTDVNLLEIIDNNWPEVLQSYMINDTKNDNSIDSPATIKTMRNCNLNYPIKVNGKTFFPPGGGVTANGENIFQVRSFLEVKRRLKNLATYLDENYRNLIPMLESDPYSLVFKLILHNFDFQKHPFIDEVTISEEITGAKLSFKGMMRNDGSGPPRFVWEKMINENMCSSVP